MRSERELLSIVLEHIEELKEGLCMLTGDLCSSGVITFEEAIVIDRYVEKHGPAAKFEDLHGYGLVVFQWEPGEKASRAAWLKKEIKKLKDEEEKK